jgi:hypothetical protein
MGNESRYNKWGPGENKIGTTEVWPVINFVKSRDNRTLPKFLCCSMYCLFCVVLFIVCV